MQNVWSLSSLKICSPACDAGASVLKDSFISQVYDRANSLLGQKIRVCGWVDNIRDLGGVRFVLLRDRSGVLQVVIKKGVTPETAIETSKELVKETVACFEGTLVESKSKLKYELQASGIQVLSKPVEPIPLEPATSTEAQLNVRLDYRWLDVRNLKVSAIFQFESWVANKFREFFRQNGFVEVFTPKIVAAGTEGGAEVFPVIYFGREAYLAQSPQFYKQMAVIAGLERVFEVGPVFRAEAHHTVKHLTEFHGLDIEMGFIEGPEDVMNMLESFFRYLAKEAEIDDSIETVRNYFDLALRVPSKVPRITIREAYEVLKERYNHQLPYMEDLDPQAERELGDYALKEYDSDFIFVTEYPWKVRPFYTMRKPQEPEWTLGFDLLFRGLEIATGSQREHRYDQLLANLRDKGLNPERFQFYLNFFKYGAPPHGGAGLGLERIVKQFLNLDNVREARLLPRDPERLTP
ncbi:Aspartyl-tRNA synthetase [Acidilobus saccharovorans 345-15]|uniref:Aspartate--tRNA ligase n=1 Tax=Acidilobus saccharovorans (strain DSM 16705 / JCM 18335 / VKM B-2471 / 345-15) TaxID=666510 RepID=D9Q0M7_ACIS3|nr:Aspartyl-tRNA synthetase [Acidilobus saccharovorans 345-15]